ncbi:MAG: uracil-DNA glycosylase [Fimbriimonadaceae bacterium]
MPGNCITECRRCPRLVAWREQIAVEKRASFAEWEYWGKPVPDFGDPSATHLVVGLAPAAHGANRTGRMFTGDRSGDWLFRALHKAGVASQPQSHSSDDGLELSGVLITAVCHCAPPDNKPTRDEIQNCSSYLTELLSSRHWAGILCLGGLAWTEVGRAFQIKLPPFGHARRHTIELSTKIVASYHPSQQNTFTGRLTEPMFDQAIQLWLA